TQLRMLVQAGQQSLIVGGQHSAHWAILGCVDGYRCILSYLISFDRTRTLTSGLRVVTTCPS
ncbi:hypothetical protein, partial [uncultured Lamprocystis sp.]|uniref:hypothetical protein n=1 Tax=uncultured Lamprocystis sp. TaxID=543132 RepID=UPI0025E12B33